MMEESSEDEDLVSKKILNDEKINDASTWIELKCASNGWIENVPVRRFRRLIVVEKVCVPDTMIAAEKVS